MAGSLPMTPGRWVALIIGAPLAFAVVGWTALTGVAYAGQASYPVNLKIPVHGSHASVSVDSGDVSLGPGPAGNMTVAGSVRYALIKPQVGWRSQPSGVSMESRCRQFTGPCSVTYTVKVPPRVGLRAVVQDGDLTAHGLPGHLVFKAGAGDIVLRSVSGDVQVTAGDGNITAAGVSGTRLAVSSSAGDISLSRLASQQVTLSSEDGNITAAGVTTSQLAVSNSAGDIRLAGLAAPDVTLTSFDGNVTVAFTRVPAAVHIVSHAGDVHLVLPRGNTAYRVSAKTLAGTTSVEVPQDSRSSHVITVTDDDGNVTISQ